MMNVIGRDEAEEEWCRFSVCVSSEGKVQQGTEFSRVTAVGKKLFLNLLVFVWRLRKRLLEGRS